MATPLYKSMKSKGTSFYAFPNSIKDFSLNNFQDNIKISPSKFILLNIPQSSGGTSTEIGTLDFVKTPLGPNDGTNPTNLYSWDPNGPRSNYDYSETLVESLRNYIANCDTVYRESRISVSKDFYNPGENKTPTESIFWKWCKKMNIIDFEPAIHKIDWDKNLSDFQNPNASSYTNRDYFRKYLWKERDINEYSCVLTQGTGNVPEITINEISKFKIGDKVQIYGTGYTGTELSTGSTYYISDITFSSTETTITLDVSSYSDSSTYTCGVKLSYHRLVQYIGEVQAVSKIQTSVNNYTEFTAMIPPHAGQTPTVLFDLFQNTNYYPGLELPILAEEIQQEINGAEYLNSPIRTKPSDYPGSYFGYFDTIDKTYSNSSGDAVRLSGDYYGVLKASNDNLSEDAYVEKLTDFNSVNIDGLSIDFNRKHYLKMSLPGSTVKNFDEFNSMVINDTVPSDFEYNAILWYYDIDDGSGRISTNLYGIEFLNNPDDDYGLNDDKTITTTRKLVTNSSQDGLSYIYNLNLDYRVDNDLSPLRYDTTSIYNLFGFDLYNNVMANYGKLNRNFMTIITEFLSMNKRINDLESILFSQTDLDEIKSKLDSHEELIKLYQTNQIVDSDTIGVEIDYTKNYPAIKFNTKQVTYDEIYNYYTSDIFEYNIENQDTGLTTSTYILASTDDPYVGVVRRGSSWTINAPNKGNTLVNIYSNIVSEVDITTGSIILSNDLAFKQSMDIIIRSNICNNLNDLQINIMFDNGTGIGKKETLLVNAFDLPIDILSYNDDDPTGSTFNNSYYYDSTSYVDSLITGTTTEVDILSSDSEIFSVDDWVYIDNFNFLTTGGTYVDYSGLFYILTKNGAQLGLGINESTGWDTEDAFIELQGKPSIFYYKGMKINILRIDESLTSDLNHRYLITRDFLSTEYIQKLNTQNA